MSQLSKSYVWSKREVTEAGSPLSDIVEFVSGTCEVVCFVGVLINREVPVFPDLNEVPCTHS